MLKGWKREFLIGILVTVVGGLLLNYVAGISPKDIFNWCKTLPKTVYTFAVHPAPISTWLLIVLVLAAVILLWKGVTSVLRGMKAPTYREYTEDTFWGVTWRWSYDLNGRIQNVWCYCGVCDTSLVYSQKEDYSEYGQGRRYTEFICERCGGKVGSLDGDKDYAVDKIKRQIDRAIRVGDWKKIIQQKAGKT